MYFSVSYGRFIKILGILVFPMDGLSPELEIFISARQPFCRISSRAYMLQYTGLTM
jgi:hypothetical protein